MKEIRRIAVGDVPMVATQEAQLKLWVSGKNVHARVGYSWECCPDFSCCYPDCAQPASVRLKFAAAEGREREKFYAKFLSAFISKLGHGGSVHVVGQTSNKGRR